MEDSSDSAEQSPVRSSKHTSRSHRSRSRSRSRSPRRHDRKEKKRRRERSPVADRSRYRTPPPRRERTPEKKRERSPSKRERSPMVERARDRSPPVDQFGRSKHPLPDKRAPTLLDQEQMYKCLSIAPLQTAHLFYFYSRMECLLQVSRQGACC